MARVNAAAREEARIGPHSILQLVPVLDARLGAAAREELLSAAEVFALPPGEGGLIDEAPAARVHQALRRNHPDLAPDLAREAGERTGDFIIQNRIPPVAAQLMRNMPPWLAGPLLTSAIEKHAWTFAGSGKFRVLSRRPLVFELLDNPIVRGEEADAPICLWHAAVFQRLFNVLVDKTIRCTETHCCAAGHAGCRFNLS